MVLSTVLIFLASVYTCIMLAYWNAWRLMPDGRLPADFVPDISITVIIPARNEKDHILPCLTSVLNAKYPAELLEILVVDDFSDDGTPQLIQAFLEGRPPDPRIQMLPLSEILADARRYQPNKKQAISTAVACARGQLIVTTDADCLVPADWLLLLSSRFSALPDLKLLTAPVGFYRERNLLQRFQSLDFLGMMGVTAAGIQLGWHHMGNGANLAYLKSAFKEVEGFHGNESIASGDDMFLIQKISAKWPGSVGFLKNPAAMNLTEAKAGWQEFWQQRLRWGAKNVALPEWSIRLILLAVWLFCFAILTAFIGIWAGIISPQIWLAALLLKFLSDWIFLREMCRYFNRPDLMRWLIPAFLMHTAYIALAGLASLLVKNYKWKGRRAIQA